MQQSDEQPQVIHVKVVDTYEPPSDQNLKLEGWVWIFFIVIIVLGQLGVIH